MLETDCTEQNSRGTPRRAPTVEQFAQPVSGSIPTIIRSFKSAVTKRFNEIRRTPDAKLWQRNYYEHIIQNENELNLIREYIANNPMNCNLDRENPDAGVGKVGIAPKEWTKHDQ